MDELGTVRWRAGDPEEHELFDSPTPGSAWRREMLVVLHGGAWPDLGRCPACGQVDFPLASLERVEAFAGIDLTGDTLAGFTAAWRGTDEACWDTAATLAYLCRACGAELPEAYAVALDRLLANRRAREG